MASLCYRNARNNADLLGQVLTPPSVARLLVDTMPSADQHPAMVIDLGAGKGALTLAYLEAFECARALAVEIDPVFVSYLRSLGNAQIAVREGSALALDLQNFPQADIILSNPPYGTMPVTSEIREILSESGLGVPLRGQWVRSDIAFVARAWSLARRGCSLGLIAASPLVQNSKYRDVRKRLASELGNLIITKLDLKTFANAEVQAFLISGQRKVSRQRSVLLRQASVNGNITDEIEIGHVASFESWDIDYHQSLKRMGLKFSNTDFPKTLGSVQSFITRGSRSANQYEALGLSAFHTTDFPSSGVDIVLDGALGKYKMAHPGDILIPRVGTRCLGKQARVCEGIGLFTDCVYRITVPQKARSLAWSSLSSSFGVEWRLANATGSCAKHLTLEALMNMPLMS